MQADIQQLRENIRLDLISYFDNIREDSNIEEDVIYVIESHFERYRMRGKNLL
jgi:hypothetical protein